MVCSGRLLNRVITVLSHRVNPPPLPNLMDSHPSVLSSADLPPSLFIVSDNWENWERERMSPLVV